MDGPLIVISKSSLLETFVFNKFQENTNHGLEPFLPSCIPNLIQEKEREKKEKLVDAVTNRKKDNILQNLSLNFHQFSRIFYANCNFIETIMQINSIFCCCFFNIDGKKIGKIGKLKNQQTFI